MLAIKGAEGKRPGMGGEKPRQIRAIPDRIRDAIPEISDLMRSSMFISWFVRELLRSAKDGAE
jgi:hypothetical protein